MMLKIRKSFRISIFAFLLALMICSFSGVSSADEPATVDDLFKFLIDNWADKQHFPFEASVDEIQGQVGEDQGADNWKEVNAAFKEEVIHGEPIYGHLPEYWELRSVLDLPDEDLRYARRVPWNPDNILSDYLVNPLMIQRALDLDPSRAADKYIKGLVIIKNNYSEQTSGSSQTEDDLLNQYYREASQVFEEVSAFDPDNLYYLIHAAANSYSAGSPDKCMDLLIKASTCKTFETPNIFPMSYLMTHLGDYEQRRGIFHDLTPRANMALFLSLGSQSGVTNRVAYEKMYQDLLQGVSGKDDWAGDFTALQRAACTLGEYEPENFNQTTAVTLVSCCIKQAMKNARERDDASMVLALLALQDRLNDVKQADNNLYPIDGTVDLYFYNYSERISDLAVIAIGQLTEESKVQKSWSETYLPLYLNVEKNICEHRIRPIFEDIYNFDYANPSEWYDTWYAKNFPSEAE